MHCTASLIIHVLLVNLCTAVILLVLSAEYQIHSPASVTVPTCIWAFIIVFIIIYRLINKI